MRQPEQFKNDRNVFRRHVDTADRLFHLRMTDKASRLPRLAILDEGERMLDRECGEQIRVDVKAELTKLFSAFAPSPNPIGV